MQLIHGSTVKDLHEDWLNFSSEDKIQYLDYRDGES